MKKLLVGMLLLGSCSVYAMSFEQSLIANSEAISKIKATYGEELDGKVFTIAKSQSVLSYEFNL